MRSAAPAFPLAASPATPSAASFATPSGRPLPLWRADRLDRSAAQGETRPTGHVALDAELPGGGWPAGGLIELLLPAPASGELRLLASTLAGASRLGPLLWIAPPFMPYAPALAALGIDTTRLVVATPARPADAAWAAEQALRSGTLAAVLWWENGTARAPGLPATLRRLHLAAEEGRTPLFALRPVAARGQSSPAPLRLALGAAGPHQLAVEVFKRRGPPMAAPLMLTLAEPLLGRLPGALLPPLLPSLSPTPHVVVRPAPERVAA
jgi:cell division inhibitor SulA